jgi:hypothetical protein
MFWYYLLLPFVQEYNIASECTCKAEAKVEWGKRYFLRCSSTRLTENLNWGKEHMQMSQVTSHNDFRKLYIGYAETVPETRASRELSI